MPITESSTWCRVCGKGRVPLHMAKDHTCADHLEMKKHVHVPVVVPTGVRKSDSFTNAVDVEGTMGSSVFQTGKLNRATRLKNWWGGIS